MCIDMYRHVFRCSQQHVPNNSLCLDMCRYVSGMCFDLCLDLCSKCDALLCTALHCAARRHSFSTTSTSSSSRQCRRSARRTPRARTRTRLIAQREDLFIEQSWGVHADKTRGMPIQNKPTVDARLPELFRPSLRTAVAAALLQPNEEEKRAATIHSVYANLCAGVRSALWRAGGRVGVCGCQAQPSSRSTPRMQQAPKVLCLFGCGLLLPCQNPTPTPPEPCGKLLFSYGPPALCQTPHNHTARGHGCGQAELMDDKPKAAWHTSRRLN